MQWEFVGHWKNTLIILDVIPIMIETIQIPISKNTFIAFAAREGDSYSFQWLGLFRYFFPFFPKMRVSGSKMACMEKSLTLMKIQKIGPCNPSL